MAVELATAYFSFLPSMAGTAAAAAPGLRALEGQAAISGARSGALMGGAIAGGIGKYVPVIGGVLAAIGIADFFGNAVSAASDLNESANAIRVSFGDAAAEVDKLGDTAATRLGLSKNDFNTLAVRFSSFARTIAGEGGDVAGVLDDLTTRGADFASVYNIEAADALTLFQSGLAGESEPLRRFGIDLSAATVESTAYRLGIAEVGSELTEQQKIQARYAAIVEQTSAVEGDRANTADEFANKQRENAAIMEDALARIGTALLPAATAFAQWVGSDENIDRLDRVVDLMVQAEPAVEGLADALIILTSINLDHLDRMLTLVGALSDGVVDLDESADMLASLPPDLQAFVVGLAGAIGQSVNTVISGVNALGDGIEDVFNGISSLLGLNQSLNIANIPLISTVLGVGGPRKFLTGAKSLTGQADGGRTVGAGWSWVGEKGPELAYMPVGARVLPNDLSVAAVSGGDRPIYTDTGALLGWVRTVANGEARLVWAMGTSDRALDLGTGGVA